MSGKSGPHARGRVGDLQIINGGGCLLEDDLLITVIIEDTSIVAKREIAGARRGIIIVLNSDVDAILNDEVRGHRSGLYRPKPNGTILIAACRVLQLDRYFSVALIIPQAIFGIEPKLRTAVRGRVLRRLEIDNGTTLNGRIG